MEEEIIAAMTDPISGKSFWEKLGRSVGKGLEKAKETSVRLGEGAVARLDLKNAKDHLESRYRLLGRAVADRMVERKEPVVEASDPAVKALLDEVAAAQAAVEEMEKKPG